MFENFCQYLTQNSKYMDYWYDDGCIRANELLSQFSEQDWQKLSQFLLSIDRDLQQICFEVIAQEDSKFAHDFILKHLKNSNAFLQYYALDTLNEQLANNFLDNIQKSKFKTLLAEAHFPQNDLSTKLLLASILNKLNQ